jgi:hypothetical protein
MIKTIKIFAICYLLYAANLLAQNDVNSVLDYTLSCRGLTREDVTIPIEFFSAAEKSPTNDSKLILPLVKDMMVHPLRAMTWLDSLWLVDDSDLIKVFKNVFNLKSDYETQMESQNKIIIEYQQMPSFDFLVGTVLRARRAEDEFLKVLSEDERKFLQKNLLSILEDSEGEDESNVDIFKFNAARDSSTYKAKKTMDILSKLDPHKNLIRTNSFLMLSECYKYYKIFSKTKNNNSNFGSLKYINNEHVQGDFYYYYDKDGIRIAIGGPGRNIYNGHFDFIIDVGGDDIYNIENEKVPLEKGDLGGFSCIIDLAGNDYYKTTSNFALAGGLFSSGFIFDKEGDDTYEATGSGNLGAAIGGLGLIYDESGNDTYRGLSFCEGAGCFGVGLIVDRKGNDVYIANSYSQGFGMTEGVGAIIENEGNDSYLVDSRSLDIGRYNDHYVSMCQGYGLGLRPYYAGGIGLIIEGGGNDIYNADIFGQGGGYWYSLGAIVDKSGHDKYNGYQYCQGAGIHLAIGLLKDYDGWDFYQSDGVSQGCGHDFGFGLLWDVKGNDNYSAYSLSQGAGNADGIGILIDESGTDGYLNKYPSNTRGYGNQRREFGSLGIFLDMSGDDFYSQPGPDSTLINSSSWGVFNDYYLKDLPEQVSGNNFKVPLDTSGKRELTPLSYSIADYFIMAKTIEPRFSQWQDYGFKMLLADSINTASYILTRLGTDDARETQAMRVLSQKIQKSISDAIIGKLQGYIDNKSTMTQSEVSFACYIFGETKNTTGKDILLQLTYDDNYRVRASAINALGKIKYDTTDVGFAEKVSNRLLELVLEKKELKLYNKDLAFALGNYKNYKSFTALNVLLGNPYYGARFTAAESMKNFGEQYILYEFQDDAIIILSHNRTPFLAFLPAMLVLSEEKFKLCMDRLFELRTFDDEIVAVNLINIIKLRRTKSSEPEFIAWCDNEVLKLQSKIKLNIR